MSPPLTGIRILDLSRVLAGPWCTMTLGDLGADVIKVEAPDTGDDTRTWGYRLPGGERSYYLATNRNKRSICVDLAHPEGQRVIRDLAATCDVMVENFKLGGLAKFGLDYDTLKAANPRLIYCSISGYGRTGPAAARAGYDFIIQGEAGLMSITGERDDLAGGGPQKVGVAVSDLMTGMYATQAIMAALIARGQSGRGQFIDMALHDVVVANLANMAALALATDKAPGRFGNAHPDIVPYQTFRASDGEIIVAVGNNNQYRKFCLNVIGRPDLWEDARFQSNPDRVANRAALVPLLEDVTKTKPRAYWLERLEAEQVPGGIVRDVLEAVTSEESTARGMLYDLPHPTAGRIRTAGSPLKLMDTPVRQPTLPPPLLGQHTDEVLAELLGYDAARLADLRAAKAIA